MAVIATRLDSFVFLYVGENICVSVQIQSLSHLEARIEPEIAALTTETLEKM